MDFLKIILDTLCLGASTGKLRVVAQIREGFDTNPYQIHEDVDDVQLAEQIISEHRKCFKPEGKEFVEMYRVYNDIGWSKPYPAQ